MTKTERNGKRKSRSEISKRRTPELGYYFIVTDTKETEQNYINGLRDAIPDSLKDKLVIKVIRDKTKNLVDEAQILASQHPQYGQPWIIFDRDQVKDFDKIIEKAQSLDINVGWSNPCIEEWFCAYFGNMPSYETSMACCEGFATTFEKVTGQKYRKSNKQIYKKLNQFGDEDTAIKVAKLKYNEQLKNGNSNPSKMVPCTTLYQLIEEIKNKIKA